MKGLISHLMEQCRQPLEIFLVFAFVPDWALLKTTLDSDVRLEDVVQHADVDGGQIWLQVQ
jgi:hypothetical protein